jgi:anti-sigma B factor antagonist
MGTMTEADRATTASDHPDGETPAGASAADATEGHDRLHVGAQRVVASGDIDIATADQLRTELIEVVDAGARIVVFDARAVNFVDSSGLRVIVDVAGRLEAAGGQFMIEGASAAMRRVLELTNLLERYRGDADDVGADAADAASPR